MKEIIILFITIAFRVSEVYPFQSSFIRNCLTAHNAIRALHDVPPLNWSAETAVNAQKWANHLAAIDQLQHDPSSTDGENLFYMYGGDPAQACDRAVNNWYQEIRNYDFKSPHLDDSTNHFSQLVWRGSKELGIGTAQSKSGNFFLVARYSPPGNIDGLFQDNVPDAKETTSDERQQDNKENNNNLDNRPPAQDESSSSQSKNDPNVVYFKEINVEPGPNELDNTTTQSKRPSPPQQNEAQYEPSENIGLESGLEPDAAYAKQETQQMQTTQTSNPIKLNPPSENATSIVAPREKTISEADRGANKMPADQKAQLRPVNQRLAPEQARPFYPEADMNTRTSEVEPKVIGAQVENHEPTETLLQQPLNDGGPKPVKMHEPAAGLTYVPPEVPKVPPKNPKTPLVVRLSPELALITPKKGKDFRVAIRFKDMVYSNDMQTPGTLAFEELKRNVTGAIIKLFDDDDDFQQVQLISVRNGSVIVTLGLLFSKDAIGHLNRLTLALQSGMLGGMPVALKYDSAVALPAGYLKPSQLNQPNGNGVCAQPCSKPNTCYPSGCTASCCAFHPAPRPVEVPSCLGTCDNKCYPDCDPECCSEPQQAPYTAGGVTALAPAPPSITCPGACHFTCYPECSPQCCASQYVPNPCHASCPAYCAPSCDNACCTVRKSIVNSLSKQYSKYRSAQRNLARQRYLKKRLGLRPLRPITARLERPVRPRQRSFYPRQPWRRPRPSLTLDNSGPDEYDEWAKKGEVTKHTVNLINKGLF